MVVGSHPTELCELAKKWGTDKWFYYTEFYHDLLKDKRKARDVLELGIGSPATMLDSLSRVGITSYITGASLFMWEEYFPEARICGLDNDRSTLINKGRIRSYYCEQSDPFSYPPEIFAGSYDLIVEDGSHVKEHQLTAVETLVPLLAPDGIYIAEDVGYLSRACRLEFAKLLPFPAELHEFHNPSLGPHIAACIVVRP